MTGRMRRALEPGHSPKFLVVIDESTECGRAVRFAARRVLRTGARLMMLSVIDASDFQHWLGVGDIMKREARERAEALIDSHVAACRQLAYEVGRRLDAGGDRMQASLVKLLACRSAEWVTREALQIHGGMGYAEEAPVSRYFVDARVLSIFEGAEETLALKVIARSLLDDAITRRAA